jgi:hypothetical protein
MIGDWEQPGMGQGSNSDLSERIVRLLEELHSVKPWEIEDEELLGFVVDMHRQAGELLEEHRRSVIVAGGRP